MFRRVQVALWAIAALFGGAALVYVLFIPPAATARGTLLVVASSARGAEIGGPAGVSLIGGPRLGRLEGAIPAAPAYKELGRLAVAPGTYRGLEVGGTAVPGPIEVSQGQVEPVLLAVDGSGLVPGGVYAGNDGFNLGLSELAGKLVPMPDFHLVDQQGAPVDRASLLGKPSVIAAFHTTCHEACPLYTGVLLELRKQVGDGVHIVEVTTDPAVDTPSVLAEYGRRLGADWTLATGTPPQVAGFWEPFGVTLSAVDAHQSTLLVVDAHGYQRIAYRGVPDVGGTLPPELFTQLSGAGLNDLRGHGSGWTAASIADALHTISSAAPTVSSGGGPAPPFSLTGYDGRRVALDQFRGRPVVVNFFASWCAPCQVELPLLQSAATAHRDVQFILIDYLDDPGSATELLAAKHVTGAPVGVDYDGSVGRRYGVASLPTTFFIRPDGTIEGAIRAQLDQATLDRHLSAITAG
ncbi:MAG TPA: SCO family protein [Candidatus Dormibacteraeota bacterium]